MDLLFETQFSVQERDLYESGLMETEEDDQRTADQGNDVFYDIQAFIGPLIFEFHQIYLGLRPVFYGNIRAQHNNDKKQDQADLFWPENAGMNDIAAEDLRPVYDDNADHGDQNDDLLYQKQDIIYFFQNSHESSHIEFRPF